MDSGSAVNKSTAYRRRMNVVSAYAKVRWTAGGRMEKTSRNEWLAWLDAFGIGEARALQLVKESRKHPATQREDHGNHSRAKGSVPG